MPANWSAVLAELHAVDSGRRRARRFGRPDGFSLVRCSSGRAVGAGQDP